MSQYFFILGRNPELSLAELAATIPSGWKPVSYSKTVLIVECEELDAESLMQRLGGTIKMGVISNTAKDISPETICKELGFADSTKKLFIGLSAYALDETIRLPSVRELRGVGIEVKRVLQEKGCKVRLVTSKEIALSSVIVKKERLLRQGTELCLFYRSAGARPPQAAHQVPRYNIEEIVTGKTLAVQEFEEASHRDYGRPERAMKVGMLPIQLTKIMLNLSRAKKDATILDPFCGLGTVLTEAAQMGYRNLVGTDFEQAMIDATKKNLEWLNQRSGVASESSRQSERSLSAATPKIRLIASPVEQLSVHLPPRSVDAIVTEPYMGPTREIRDLRSVCRQAGFEIRDLVDLYISAFREFAKIMKPNGRVVFIMPAFRNNATLTKTSERVLPEIKKLGFEPIQLLPTAYSLLPTYSITYSRPDQKVLREIFVLEFTPSPRAD
ncbi:MAG: hypothetical protein Q7S48_02630 [bacterium]|nr:hypothetical protein [bacterium]